MEERWRMKKKQRMEKRWKWRLIVQTCEHVFRL